MESMLGKLTEINDIGNYAQARTWATDIEKNFLNALEKARNVENIHEGEKNKKIIEQEQALEAIKAHKESFREPAAIIPRQRKEVER